MRRYVVQYTFVTNVGNVVKWTRSYYHAKAVKLVKAFNREVENGVAFIRRSVVRQRS